MNRRAAFSCSTTISIIIVLLVAPFSAPADGAASTIITRDGETGTSSIGQTGVDLAGSIGQRIDDLVASATNNTLTDGIDDMDLSGRIASARLNLSSGQVEETFFGNWSAQINSIGNSSFSAEFGSGDARYTIDNLTLNSFQRVNDHVVLGGTADVTSGAQSWPDAAVSIVIIGGRALAIGFEDPELSGVFSGQPVIGVVSP